MVEKRTLVFVNLAIIVWAITATTFVGYYYFQNELNADQLSSTQNSLSKIAVNYNTATEKYDSLLSDYALVRRDYMNYSYNLISDYSMLMPDLQILIINLGGNYSDILAQADLNESYSQLSTDYSAMMEKTNVTETDFASLLNKCNNLLGLFAFRELSAVLSDATTLSVSVEINYGNGTIQWHNETEALPGQTLFGIMQKIAFVNYSYYAFADPGHVLVNSINNVAAYTDPSYASGYSWIWYYHDSTKGMWINGPVGCDAWMLQNDGVYRWSYERWQYP